jgi:hypothetical protein
MPVLGERVKPTATIIVLLIRLPTIGSKPKRKTNQSGASTNSVPPTTRARFLFLRAALLSPKA